MKDKDYNKIEKIEKDGINITIKKSDKTPHNQRFYINEIGKSNFVDDKSLINPIINSFDKRKIHYPVVFGVPRSGSTLVRNILNTIFDGRIGVQTHGAFGEIEENARVVATYRDFRDCTVSKWRMNHAGFDKEEDKIIGRWNKGTGAIVPEHMESITKGANSHIQTSAENLRNRVGHLDGLDKRWDNSDRGFLYKDPNHMKVNNGIVYFARYEQFNDNLDLLFDHFENFFQINIVKDLRQFLHDRWNKERVKKVYSDNIGPFGGYDRETEIHGQHIYKGKTGTWKEILHKDDHDAMTEFWKTQLATWGYIKGGVKYR